MKRLILLISCLLFAAISSNAQWIISKTVIPASPVAGDIVKVVASIDFSSGSCDQKLLNISRNGNDFYANALHCLGMLTFICNDADTFSLGQLSSGIYTCHLQVNAGSGSLPCSPGIVPGPTDSITFTVAEATGIETQQPRVLSVSLTEGGQALFVNSAEEFFQGDAIATIWSLQGSLLLQCMVHRGQSLIDISTLARGSYLLTLQSEELGERKSAFFVKE